MHPARIYAEFSFISFARVARSFVTMDYFRFARHFGGMKLAGDPHEFLICPSRLPYVAWAIVTLIARSGPLLHRVGTAIWTQS